jgi:hypothetical protein
VPTRHGHLQVLVRGYGHDVTIACASEIIARHPRSYEREAVIFDPLHYLALLEQKTRALDQAAPLLGWQLPACYLQLRRLLEARLKKHGSREYVQVLRLLETFALDEVTHAIEDALQLGTIGFDAVKLLRFQKQIASYELLIVDELGFVPLSKTGAELLFEMLSQRYERGSTLVTSNLPFAEWTEVLGSERLTGALLDRLTHHVHILEMNGDSLRLKHSKRKRNPTNP